MRRQVNHAHPSLAKLSLDPIRAELVALLQVERWRTGRRLSDEEARHTRIEPGQEVRARRRLVVGRQQATEVGGQLDVPSAAPLDEGDPIPRRKIEALDEQLLQQWFVHRFSKA